MMGEDGLKLDYDQFAQFFSETIGRTHMLVGITEYDLFVIIGAVLNKDNHYHPDENKYGFLIELLVKLLTVKITTV